MQGADARLHDIDADGHADLLVDDRSPESIRLFRGRGDGTFSGATSIDVGGDPYRGMSLADVTGDGLADLITPNPDLVAVLVAEEDGGFRPQATLPAPFGPFSVVAADLNGDGSAEVLVASYAGGEVAVPVGAATPLVVEPIRRPAWSKRVFRSEGRRLPSRPGPGRRVGGHQGCVREERSQGFGPSR